METADFVTTNYLLSQILVNTRDEALSNGLTKGWYVSKIQEALAEISFNTFFNEEHCDYFDWNEAGTYQIQVPAGCFSVKEIYVFEGTSSEITSSNVVNLKVNFTRGSQTSGYTARIKHQNEEDIMQDYSAVPDSLLFGRIINGVISLSNSCGNWSNVRVVYYGVPFDIGQVPAIPIYLKEYVVDYVTERFFFVAKVDDKYKRLDWEDAMFRLDGGARNGIRRLGTKKEAERRCKSMSKFERMAMAEYWTRAQHLGL